MKVKEEERRIIVATIHQENIWARLILALIQHCKIHVLGNGLNGRTSNNSCVYHFNNILCSFPDTVLLCGNSTPYISNFNQTTNCSDSAFFAASLGIERYTDYTDSLRNNFDSLYHAKCLQAFKYESFTVKHSVTEFHYTLYYYDQTGNLIKTVPPSGRCTKTETVHGCNR